MIFASGILNNKVAVVTGGATGIGHGIATALHTYGAKVVIAARNLERCEQVATELRLKGGHVLAMGCDVRDSVAVDATMANVYREFGAIDILVNNAAGNFFCPAAAMSDRAWRAVTGIDLDGTFYCSRAASRYMIENKSGRIINISTTLAQRGFPGMAHMTAAKAGIEALTRTLAAEWGEFGIRVNCISPGVVDTEGVRKAFALSPDLLTSIADRIPAGRLGRVEEIASVAVFLASSAGDFVTGANWVIDGGGELGSGIREHYSGTN